ncbi:MAG: molybdopterin molybdotransferase MoeA [Chloroflexi bacterium]|nr:molybdopterin molybdotransferase MoeA [Chloroflexota bacterium]
MSESKELFQVLAPEVAWQVFRSHLHPHVRRETIPTEDALDRVLADDLLAPHDLPMFRRSTVDGYAVAAQDTYGASPGLPAFLTVVGEVPMGRAPEVDVGVGEAVLVHTGGMIPESADAVVMLENVQQVDEESIEVFHPVAPGENVIQVGEDIRAGEPILPRGHRLRPQDLGGLMALGITQVPVARPPRVAIISTGDEVIPPDQTPTLGQVRDINSYTLSALTLRAGGHPWRLGIVPDKPEALRAALKKAQAEADIIVLSAGSSVSARDMSAEEINKLGRPGVLVHGISQRPGKPTILAVCDGTPVIGLPGNPVSAMVNFIYFAIPTIRLWLGAREERPCTVKARLARNIPSIPGREDWIQVRLEERDGELWAVPVLGKSNLIYTLIRSDGMFLVPLDSNGLPEGSEVEVFLHR